MVRLGIMSKNATPAITFFSSIQEACGMHGSIEKALSSGLKAINIFFAYSVAPRDGQGDAGESQGAPREPWVHHPWLSHGSPWPSLGAAE